MNQRSIQNLLIKTSDKTKSKRKKLKAIKKGLLDKDLHKEGGETYLKGDFSFKNKFFSCFLIFYHIVFQENCLTKNIITFELIVITT